MQTVIPTGDVKAKKYWSGTLAVDVVKKSYWEKRFIGSDDNNIIQRRTELESAPGEAISFDLSVQLRAKPTYGDARLVGREENLRFYTDSVKIDQVRHAVSAGGRMTRKRTVHDLRRVARARLGDYFSRLWDEYMFMYLSGSRGINQDFVEDLAFTGFAGNAFAAPDADHIIYAGGNTTAAAMDANDKMTRLEIEKAIVKSGMMQALNPELTNMVPVSIEGDDRYVIIMNPVQVFDLRNEVSTTNQGWLDIQKAAAAAQGSNNPIFKGGLGMINGTILHEHRNVIRFGNYGAGSNVSAARALFLGRQAGIVAYGTSGGLRFDWQEELKDYGNEINVASGFIGGIKKAQFNSKDFGVIALDTAAAMP